MASTLSLNSTESIQLSGVVPDWSASVPLAQLAVYHLDFLSTVFTTPQLQNENVLNNALRRYELHWLPLCARYQGEILEPPLDVHWMWHCHMLSPITYAKDCNAIIGYIPNHTLRSRTSEEFNSVTEKTQNLWSELYPNEPFVCDVTKRADVNANVQLIGSHQSKLTHDMLDATRRQKDFYYQVSLGHFRDSKFLLRAVDRYVKFLHLKKTSPDLFTVPMYDIDLIWHTHQLCPHSYACDTRDLLGEVLNHDDKDQDRGPASKLSTSSTQTRASWSQMYGERMALPGTCYRGESLSQHISKDILRMPLALRCMLHVEKLTLSGGHQTDVIQARLTAGDSGRTLLELPTVEGTPVKWHQNQYITTDQVRGQPFANLDLVPVNRSGVWGTLVGTSLPVMKLTSDFYVEKRVPQGYMEHNSTEKLPRQLSIVLQANQNGYKAMMAATLAGVRPAESQTLTICWGRAITRRLSKETREELSPLNVPPPAVHAAPPVLCTVHTHTLTMKDLELYTVRIVQCNTPKLNVVQVFSGDNLVAMSELCTADQLPRPMQVESRMTTVTLDTQRGENGMIIKNHAGDWGIVKGCRSHSVEGEESGETLVIPGQLEVTLTLLSPYRVGRFTLTERGMWQKLHLPGAAPRIFEMFGSEGISVDMEACTVQLGRDCKHIAEFIATLFSVWI